MLEEILKEIYEFITSDKFTAICTSVLAVLLAIWPYVRKVLNAKQLAKIENMKIKLNNASAELNTILMENKEMKKLIADLSNQYSLVLENAKAQSEAMRKAFNSSNLKQDVKNDIEQILLRGNQKISDFQSNNYQKTAVEAVEIEKAEEVSSSIAQEADKTSENQADSIEVIVE